MAANLEWDGGEPVPTSQSPKHSLAAGELPPAVRAALWHGDQLGSPVESVIPTGFPELDAELPGGGWPCHSLTEILQAQPSVAEWRLVASAARQITATGRDLVLIGPPRIPHIPGFQHDGIDQRRIVWFKAETPAERLWVTEQVIKANAAGVVISWMPQARQEQIRRLQICAHACEAPIFLCRQEAAAREPSAAALRVHVSAALDWELHVQLLKRKGPTHEGHIVLRSVPADVDAILTPRLRRPSLLLAARRPGVTQDSHEVPHVVGSPAARPSTRGRIGTH